MKRFFYCEFGPIKLEPERQVNENEYTGPGGYWLVKCVYKCGT